MFSKSPQHAKFSLSILATAITLSTSANATQLTPVQAEQSALVKAKKTDASIETITVYGRHNQLILNSGTATKSNMNLMETPAAVVIVDKLLLEDQATATLQESLRNVSGLSQAGNNYGIGDNLMLRGLGANYTYDGMYGGAGLGNSFNPTRSTTNIESVEVLKGPATGLYGIGSAGGVINLVEKKPLQKETYQVKAVLGQWENRGVMIDATSALSDNTAYRFVANTETSDGYRGLSSARNEIYGSLLFNLTDNQELIASVAFINDSNQVDSIGHPVRIFNRDSVNGANGLVTADDLPNDLTNKGIELTPAQREELANSITSDDGSHPFDLGSQGLISPISEPNKGEELRIKFDYSIGFGQDTSLRQQFQHRQYESDHVRQTGVYNYVYWDRRGVVNANPRAPLVIDNVLYPYAARRQEYRKSSVEEKSLQYFADFNTNWSLGRFNGEHLISANYEQRDIDSKSWSIWDGDYTQKDQDGNVAYQGKLPYILDIRNPNWTNKSFDELDPILRSNYSKTVKAYGISFQEVVYFNDILTGRVGMARSRIEQEYTQHETPRYPDGKAPNDQTDSGNSYNVGLNYRIMPEFATFVNLSKGVTAYGLLDDVQKEIPNSESKSFDVGVRFTAFDEELLASFVYFETRKTNLRRSNPIYTDNEEDAISNDGVAQYLYDNEDSTKGYELDVNLAINEQWSMNANATYQNAIEIRNQNTQPRSGQRKGIPKKFASIWTSYLQTLDGLDSPIKFSIGATYTSKRTINSTSFGLPTSTIDAYTVLDAGVSYDIDKWNIQLNLRNLTDETYYNKPLFIGGLPGDSRNAKLTVKYNF
jgi:iron complex outermembrane receptor protein